MLNLFKPGQIGRLRLNNRIIMAAMGNRGLIEPDGRFSTRAIDYFAARAAGGVAMVTTGLTYVDVVVESHLVGPFSYSSPRADTIIYLARLEEIANAIHAHEAKFSVQLTAGRGRISVAADQKAGRAVAPSSVPCFWSPHMNARALTVEEIKTLVDSFGIAAGLAKSAGADAIELHAHEGYLLDEFTTALWNKRTDEYGGDLERRLRFPQEIIARIKAEAGADFPVIYKISSSHHLNGGRDIAESCEIAKRLQKVGVDAFQVDAGCYEASHWAHPPTYMSPEVFFEGIEAIKRAVDVPVIAVGKLGYPEVAERVLEEGKADFIALGRPLLADPDWPRKVREGRLSDIRPCLGCHEGCLRRVFASQYISCTVNPATGMERELSLTPAQKKKRVLVVGGGPAGMEVAIIAALRGHRVTLWEKSDKLGGNLIPASVPDFKSDYRAYLDYLQNQTKKLGIDVRLKKEATPELIQKMNADEVVIATGAVPLIPELPGVEKSITAVDALLGKKAVGGEVVVVGGGQVGCETAVWLAQQGKKVTVVEKLGDILPDMFLSNRMMLVEMLDKAGVIILTNSEATEITDEGVIIRKNGELQVVKADTIVLSVGMTYPRELANDLEGQLSVHTISDFAEPQNLMRAIWQAYRIARLI